MTAAGIAREVREVPLEHLYRAAKAWQGDMEKHQRTGRPDLARLARRQRDRYLDLCATAVMLFGDDPPSTDDQAKADPGEVA